MIVRNDDGKVLPHLEAHTYWQSFDYGFGPRATYQIRDGRRYYSLGSPFSMPQITENFYNIATAVWSLNTTTVESVVTSLQSCNLFSFLGLFILFFPTIFPSFVL